MKKYTESLDLNFDPFEPFASGKEFFTGGNRQQLLDQLIEHTHYSQSIMTVTGCLGCGKSTLANAYCQSFADAAVCVLIPATLFMNKTQFLEKLAEQIPVHLSEEETESVVVSIKSFAARLDLEAKSLLIVIDDAHELGSDVLDLVTSLTANAAAGIHILMFGEMQLTSMLQNALSANLAQALQEFEMSELGGEDTVEYVRLKLAGAGYTGELPLSGSELGKIHNSANGIPGTINALVANALESSVADTLPVSEKIPSFIARGNRYWAVAAILLTLLVTTFILTDPDPGAEPQSIATINMPIDIPVSSQPAQDSPVRTITQESQQPEEPVVSPIVNEEQAEAETEIAEVETLEPVEEEQAGAITGNDEIVAATAAATEIAEIKDPELNLRDFEKSLLDFPGSSYTVQIMGSHSETNVRQFIEEELNSSQRGYFETRFQDKPWFVVVLGQFENRDEATRAIAELPESLRSLQPWVRTLADIQADIRSLNSIN